MNRSIMAFTLVFSLAAFLLADDKQPLDKTGPAAKVGQTSEASDPAAKKKDPMPEGKDKPTGSKESKPAEKPKEVKNPQTNEKDLNDPKSKKEEKPKAEEKPKTVEQPKKEEMPKSGDNPSSRAPIAAELLAGQSQFAQALYSTLAKKEKGNFAYSPFSVSQALSLAAEGARGETLDEITAALKVKLAAPQRHAAIAGLNLELARSPQGGNELAIANGLWAQPEKELLPEFLRIGREFYRAELRPAHFATDAERERKEINAWVAKATREKIPELLPPGSLDSLTRLVLVNAVYLKANWEYPFDPKLTEEQPFFVTPEKSVPVAMMLRTGTMPLVENDGGQMIALPYEGKDLEMILLLPKQGSSPDAYLAARPWEELASQFPVWEEKDAEPSSPAAAIAKVGQRKRTAVVLSLPRFELEWKANLRPALEQLGMQRAFDPKRADLSGLDGKGELFLAQVFHAAKIEVNEKGTIAAAATGAGFKSRSAMKITPVTFDRPFAFVIRHVPTGTILFVGRVNEPKSKEPAMKKSDDEGK